MPIKFKFCMYKSPQQSYLCAPMKRQFIFPLFLSVFLLLLLGGCKSEFEKIRASGDTELIHKKAFELYEQEEYLRAQTLFELIIPAYRGRPELEKIYFTYAYTYYYLNKFILSNYYFKTFAATFPTSSYKEEAEFMSAYSHYQLSPIYRLEQSYSEKAIDGFQLFVNTYPESERVKEANRFVKRWEDEKLAIENGRWGPFIRFKKKSIKLPRVDKKAMSSEQAAELTLEQVKELVEAEIPDAFKKKTRAKKKK